MKNLRLPLVLGLVILLSACATRSMETELTRCVYPDSPRTPAPEFVCGGTVTGYPVSVLRASQNSDLSVSQRMQDTLDSQIDRWVAELADEWFAEADANRQARHYLQDWLSDQARIVRSRVSPTATLWLLVAIPVDLATLQQQTQAAVVALSD